MNTTTTPYNQTAEMTVDIYNWRGSETEKVVAIEYHPDRSGKLRPFQVFTDGGGYDFEYCRRDDQIYWHNSYNSSPYLHALCNKRESRSAFWRAPGTTVTNGGLLSKRNLTDAQIRRMGYLVLSSALANPFDDALGDTPTVYCSRCRDWLPNDWENPCEHIWWCEKCNLESRPGERCKHRRSAR